MSESPNPETADPERAVIRRAVAADRVALVDLRLGMVREIADRRRAAGADPGRADADSLRDTTLRWIDDHIGRDFLAWIAELDGRPVSTAGLMWFNHPPTPANPGGVEAYVMSVYTEPGARRMGLARALMERLIEDARAAGVWRIWLRASDDGRPLYESLGFVAMDDDYRLTLP